MFDKASSIIKDPSKFDFDYIPKNLVNRSVQMQQMETLFRPLVESGRPCNAFLMGSVGTGKTVTAKKFCGDLKEYCFGRNIKLEWLYINCRSSNSENAVIVNLIHHFDPGFPERGFSTEEMARILMNHLLKNKGNLVIILDEVDVLLKKNSVDLIYQITRLSDPSGRSIPISLMMISQQSIYELMDEASVSTFKKSTMVKFNKYSQEELRQIVTERAEEALFPGRISDDALDQIAESSEEYGDARMALELLEHAAIIAENNTLGEVTVEDIRSAKSHIYSMLSEDKLVSLDINRKLVLLSAARAMKQNVVILTSTVEKTYAIVCEEYNVPARKHTQFWKYLQDLEKLGFVKTKTTSDGNLGRTTKVGLPDFPAKELSKMLEGLIEDDLSRQVDLDEM